MWRTCGKLYHMPTSPSTSVRIDSDVVRILRKLAHKNNTSIKALIEAAVAESYRHRYPDQKLPRWAREVPTWG